MSGGKDHKEVAENPENKFCCIRPQGKCACGNDYRENCKPSWHTFKYPQKSTQRKEVEVGEEIFKMIREYTNFRSYEAHHVLCVASIKGIIDPDASKPPGDVGFVASQTEWCVNDKQNMIALPMWPHTLRWYCSMITGEIREVQDEKGRKAKLGPPPFQNLPQHDYDHKRYIEEVEAELKELVKDVKEVEHELQSDALKQELNDLVVNFKNLLGEVRGFRENGTHAAWEAGLNGAEKWYLPFSMADDGQVTSRAFPVTGGRGYMAEKIEAMVDAFWKEGQWKLA